MLTDKEGVLYAVDWDTLIFAPVERNLMVIGAGIGDSGRTPTEEESLFYQGYGHTEINQGETLWVDQKLRKQGYGKQLLKVLELEAIKQGCVFSIVDTLAFQAEEFYLKSEYEPMGEIKNIGMNIQEFFLGRYCK